MGVFDFMKKKKGDADADNTDESKKVTVDPLDNIDISKELDKVDTSKMSIKEKMALKTFKLLPKKQQKKMLEQMMNPDNMRKLLNPQHVQKNKPEILKQLDQAVKAGMIPKNQAEAIKSQLGLR